MSKINQILTEWIPGDIHSLKWLQKKGVAQNLAYEYFQNGSLDKLGPGIYSRKNEKLKWMGGVRLLQEELEKKIHVSGKTALELHGHSHYVPMKEKTIIELKTYSKANIPKWFFKINFNCEFHFRQSALFHDDIDLTEYTHEGGIHFYLSSRELAILELIHSLDLSHSFETAENYLNGLQTLRPKVVQSLLEKCSSVKTKRVFLFLAEKLNLPFFDQLNLKTINLGKGKRQIITSNGELNKKYLITVPKQEEENPF